MCELFGKSSRHPATINLALPVFAAHGGGTAPNKDGWGFAWYEQSDIRLIKDTRAAATSPWVRFIEERGLESHTVIGHVRYATTGDVAIANTHPFGRELGGRMHVFAHNGVVDAILDDDRFSSRSYRPLGRTDSEHAFCALLDRLAELWRTSPDVPALDQRMAVVAGFARELRALGPANFLYSDSETLFAHSHRRRGGDGIVRPPGLHMLTFGGQALSGGGIRLGQVEDQGDGEQQSLLLASVPLSDHDWQPVEEGTVLAIENGVVQRTATQ